MSKDKRGSARVAELQKLIESLGGTFECCYFAFGDYDVVGIADMPDNVSLAAFSLMAGAAGLAVVKTTVLITADKTDQATKKFSATAWAVGGSAELPLLSF